MKTYRITIPLQIVEIDNWGGEKENTQIETIELEVEAHGSYEVARKLEKVLSKLLEFGK